MRRYLPLFLIAFFVLVIVLTGSTYLSGYAGRPSRDNIKYITVYTTLPVEQLSILGQEYEKTQNVRVDIVPLSEQELLSRLKDEVNAPKADIIFSTRGVLEQAKGMHLLASYSSEQTDIVPERFKDNDSMWTGIWYDPIIFAANADFLKNQAQPPSKWTDLVKNNKVRVAITDFLAADASANLLYTLVSANGETQTLAFLKKLHPQIVQYAKFLATPARMAGMGECDVAISVQSEALRYAQDGFPIKIIYPEDGTAYLLTGVGLAKGAPHSFEATQFVEWLLQNDVQTVLQNHKFFFTPTNPEIKFTADNAGRNIKLIDNSKVAAAEQRRLLDQWVQTVRLGPKQALN